MWWLWSGALAADVLPVERVRYYETGVGWFERRGAVRSLTSLPVPASHLDDALKSLVVLGGDVEVGAVTFPSSPGRDAARVAAGLPSEQVGFDDALRALLGVSVELETADGPIAGVLIDVDGPLAAPEPVDGEPARVDAAQYALTVLSADGALRRATTDRLRSIRSDEPDVAERLSTATRTLAQGRARQTQRLDLRVWGGGELALGYLAEAPVWRVNYRVVVGGPEARLQAWALIHNDTDEDWSRVTVELANGEPDSFLYPLAAPRYAERELVTPEVHLSTVPQLAATTPDELWTTGSGGSSGYGSGSGAFGARGSGGVGHVLTGEGVALARLKEAEPVETPTQFIYKVARPVDLPAHHSALVPLVHDAVPTERAIAFAPDSARGRTAVWLENGTGRTLPSGVIAVLEAGGLAGESTLQRLKPGESQLLFLGNELDVDLSWTDARTEAAPVGLSFARGQLRLDEEDASTRTYAVRNRSGGARALWVASALPPEAEVVGLRTEIDRHRGWTWTVLDVPAGSSERVVRTSTRRTHTLAPEQVAEPEYRRWAELGLADGGVLLRAADRRAALDRLDVERAGLDAEQARARAELEGLRASLRAAEGSDGTGALVRRAASVEAELRRLDARLADARARRTAAVDALVDALRALEPDGSAATP